jgi:pimeloyl-ACP methyl ester carboxylesterase
MKRASVLVVSLAIALLADAQWSPPPLPDLKFAAIGARANYLGDRWSFMEAGSSDAPILVMLHGVGGNSSDWRFQFAGLSDRFRIVAWNAPGYMLSDGLKTETPGCLDYADALADFLNALNLDRVNLVANSFGTFVAQCFAMHYPARVIKLAFTGAIAGRNDGPEVEKQRIAGRAAQVATGGYGFGARADALLGSGVSPELRELVRNGVRATNPRGFMQAVYAVVTDDPSPEQVAAQVKVPVLLMTGSDDRVSPVDTNAAVLQRALPNATLEVLEGIGHLPQQEAPERVNGLLAEFFGD